MWDSVHFGWSIHLKMAWIIQFSPKNIVSKKVYQESVKQSGHFLLNKSPSWDRIQTREPFHSIQALYPCTTGIGCTNGILEIIKSKSRFQEEFLLTNNSKFKRFLVVFPFGAIIFLFHHLGATTVLCISNFTVIAAY